MKKLFIAALMMASSAGVFAQHEVGSFTVQPKVGGTLTTIVGDNTDDCQMKFGLVAGAEVEYQATNLIGVAAGVNYSMQGAKIKNSDDNLKLEYVNIPIVANFYVAPNFALKLGLQPAFKTSAKVGDTDVKDAYKSFDLSIPVGASYEIENFVIDARYNIGVTKVNEHIEALGGAIKVGDFSQRNSVIQLTVGYRFDL